MFKIHEATFIMKLDARRYKCIHNKNRRIRHKNLCSLDALMIGINQNRYYMQKKYLPYCRLI